MTLRLLKEALSRRWGRVALGVLSVLLGVALGTALLGLNAVSADRLTRELRAYGANILVTPRTQALVMAAGGITFTPPAEGELINEADLPKLKTIFWKHNILAFAPFLSLTATVGEQPVVVTGTWFHETMPTPDGNFTTGVEALFPAWRIEGQAPQQAEDALVGAALARNLALSLGDTFSLAYQGRPRNLRASGLLYSGGLEEDQVLVRLPLAQELAGLSRGADRLLVSAMTIPKEKLAADIRDKDPSVMTPEEYDKWYCSPVLGAITTQIEEALPGASARAIRQVSEAEASFVLRTQLLIVLMTFVALVVSALVVLTTMTAMVMERRAEIGLMKALGADDGQIAFLFALEALVMALAGGAGGYLLGWGIGHFLGPYFFGASLPLNLSLVPLSLLLALMVAAAGSALPIWRAVRVAPVGLLREGP